LDTTPFVAVAEQTLRGLKENIFEQLRRSEYFVFIDFKRERLGDTKDHRGSLVSHKELAIASFLDIEALVLQENGVKRLDSLVQFLQTNAIAFTDRHTLPNVVADKIQVQGWSPRWRNELVLERVEFSDASQIINTGPGVSPMTSMTRFFHIKVHNCHREKLATNCYVYMQKATKRPNTNIPLRTIEFKWSGTRLPSVGIAPGAEREFDTFHICHVEPTTLRFNVFTDATDYYPKFPPGAGEYELSYLVISDNFPPAQGSFVLNLEGSVDQTTF
jgi:hypothetical protein